jgi:23S rRNA pseudouridine1911/1915/1917 synthase
MIPTEHVESFTVSQVPSNIRLDTYLREHYPETSRGTFQRLIAEGCVRVNNKTVKPTHQPAPGETIEIRWPAPIPSIAQPEDIPLDIVYEDEYLLVINKPAGLVVHPAAGHQEHTLVNALLHHCSGQLSGIGGVARPGIVHRLDQDTSGCLVVAKDDATHLSLSEQFALRHVDKLYDALVCGLVQKHEGDIRMAIARHPSHRKRMAVTTGKGRPAWTSYIVQEHLVEATWVEARLHTGRTHQIRVHFHHLGHPLVGDAVYGQRQNRRLEEISGFKASRQMLHSRTLSLKHPHTGERMSFTAPLPKDFLEALSVLRPPISAND